MRRRHIRIYDDLKSALAPSYPVISLDAPRSVVYQHIHRAFPSREDGDTESGSEGGAQSSGSVSSSLLEEYEFRETEQALTFLWESRLSPWQRLVLSLERLLGKRPDR